MARRSWWIAVAAVLGAAALVVALGWRGRGRGRGRDAAPAAGALVRPAPAPAAVPDPPVVPDPPPATVAAAELTSEQERVAARALDLLDDAIARAERQLAEARAAGDAVAVRDLDVDLTRLRAARQQRATALGQ
jgi:hypothetical protein